MAQFISMSQDQIFSTVKLTSDVDFDPNNIRSGNMTKEDHLLQVYRRIVELEKEHDRCCRDIIFWEARVQIVKANNQNLLQEGLRYGGNVVSSFAENVTVGKMRRGLPYTVVFPVKWDGNKYTTRNAGVAVSVTDCSCSSVYNTNQEKTIVNYRIVEDEWLGVAKCTKTQTNLAGFWVTNNNGNENKRKTVIGQWINPNNIWASFTHNVSDDGTVTITDHRMNTDYNIIRYYTQWMLRECADGTIWADAQ